jgi:adenylylsulfate kinase
VSWAIWITGRPGSGKSTLARAVAARLSDEGLPVSVLELDAMRRVVTPIPTYSDAERDLIYRALVWVASILVKAGVPVIVDATAHRREWRDLARTVLPAFAEVQLLCGLDACRGRAAARANGQASRDVYARAGTPGARVPGVDLQYEAASAPELTIDTETMAVDAAAALACELVRTLPAPISRATGEAWAIWITGLPGSGKTTIACAVAETLSRSGVTARVLELGDVLGFIARSGDTPLAEVIAHRTLVFAGKVLTEAGQPVIVDATAPIRAWRELARVLIPKFAEVQLLCPPEICATRERAVRWRLMGCAHTPPRHRHEAPDIVLAYEPSLRPDVTVYTNIGDPGSAAATVLSLVHRLHCAPAKAPWTSALAG